MNKGFNKDGYILPSGEVVKYQADISNIQPKVIEELRNEQVNGWQIFLLHRAILEMEERISTSHNCPLRPDKINDLIDKKIAEQPERVMGKLEKIATRFTIILNALVLLGISLMFIFGKLKIQ